MDELVQLTNATALPADPHGPSGAAQVGGATREREGWLALVQLLGAAPPVEAAALVAGIERRRKRQRRAQLVRLAVAASLLVGLGVLAWQQRPAVLADRSDSPASQSVDPGATGRAAMAAGSADAGQQEVTAWVDDWDDAVAQVAGELYAVESAWRERPSLAEAVLSDLDRLEAELQYNAL